MAALVKFITVLGFASALSLAATSSFAQSQALLLCTTVIGVTSHFDNVPPQAAEIPPASGGYGQLQPLW